MFYTYELVDPRDQSVFYVGKGKNDRLRAHEKEARAGRRGPKCRRIREIIAAGHVPTARIVERFADERAAYEAERALIEAHGAESLTNIMVGGHGGWTKKASPKRAARDTIRKCVDFIRRVMALYLSGYRAVYTDRNGREFDFLAEGYKIAMSLKAKAGDDYFDKTVGVPTWQPA